MPTRKSPLGLGARSTLEPSVYAFRAVLALGHRLRGLMDDRLRPDGVTTMQAALITVVVSLGRPSIAEAADALGTTRQNVTQLLRPLERKGLLRIEADPHDGRRKQLIATTTSRAYWSTRDEADIAATRAWFAALSDDELGVLNRLLTRLLDGPDSYPA